METYEIIVMWGSKCEFSGGLTKEEVDARVALLNKAFRFTGWTQDEWTGDWEKDGQRVNILVSKELTEEEMEEVGPWSEFEQGWRNIREDERAAVARQVAEDAVWAARPRYTSSYQGVQGSWNPEDGWIYEP